MTLYFRAEEDFLLFQPVAESTDAFTTQNWMLWQLKKRGNWDRPAVKLKWEMSGSHGKIYRSPK